MARKFKLYENQRYARSAQVYIDAKTGKFQASISGLEVNGASYPEITKKLDEIFAESANLKWIKVIEFDVNRWIASSNNYELHQTGFRIEARIAWYTQIENETWLVYKTTITEATDRLKTEAAKPVAIRSNFELFKVAKRYDGGLTMRVPYTDELWQQLKLLQQQIGALYARLEHTLNESQVELPGLNADLTMITTVVDVK
jgi:hypothetical protein